MHQFTLWSFDVGQSTAKFRKIRYVIITANTHIKHIEFENFSQELERHALTISLAHRKQPRSLSTSSTILDRKQSICFEQIAKIDFKGNYLHLFDPFVGS